MTTRASWAAVNASHGRVATIGIMAFASGNILHPAAAGAPKRETSTAPILLELRVAPQITHGSEIGTKLCLCPVIAVEDVAVDRLRPAASRVRGPRRGRPSRSRGGLCGSWAPKAPEALRGSPEEVYGRRRAAAACMEGRGVKRPPERWEYGRGRYARQWAATAFRPCVASRQRGSRPTAPPLQPAASPPCASPLLAPGR